MIWELHDEITKHVLSQDDALLLHLIDAICHPSFHNLGILPQRRGCQAVENVDQSRQEWLY